MNLIKGEVWSSLQYLQYLKHYIVRVYVERQPNNSYPVSVSWTPFIGIDMDNDPVVEPLI